MLRRKGCPMRYSTLLLLLLLLGLAGCGQAAVPAATAPGGATPPAAPAGNITPVFAFSEAVAGKNRVAIGLGARHPTERTSRQGAPALHNLDENNPAVKFEADVTYFGQGLPAAFYVAYPTFDKPGNWGVEYQAQLPGQAEPSVSRQRLEVKPSSPVPNIGQPAIGATTRRSRISVPDAAQLSSGTNMIPAYVPG